MAEFYNMIWYLEKALRENDNLPNDKKMNKSLYKDIQSFLVEVENGTS